MKEWAVLINGINGFLGSRAAELLIERGAVVVGFDIVKSLSPSLNLLRQKGTLVYVRDSLPAAFRKMTALAGNRKKRAVMHFAGISNALICQNYPAAAFDANVALTQKVMECAAHFQVDRLLFPSTGYVYRPMGGKKIAEDSAVEAAGIYAATKLAAEDIIRGYARLYGVPSIIIRLSNVYGPGSGKDTVIGRIVNQIKNQRPISVQDLRPVRDFIYIDDAIEAAMFLLAVSIKRTFCLAVNVSTGKGSSIGRVVTAAEKLSGNASIMRSEVKTGKISHLILDNTLLYKLTKWRPSITVMEGLRFLIKGHYGKKA